MAKQKKTEPIPLTLTAFALAPVADRDWQPVRLTIEDGAIVAVEPVGLAAYPYIQTAYMRLAGDVLDFGQLNQIDPRKIARGIAEGDNA